jgi:hypothetical protein
MRSRWSDFGAGSPTVVQPAGKSLPSGQTEYCSSWYGIDRRRHYHGEPRNHDPRLNQRRSAVGHAEWHSHQCGKGEQKTDKEYREREPSGYHPRNHKSYLRTAMHKLDAYTRHKAVVRARQLGLLP